MQKLKGIYALVLFLLSFSSCKDSEPTFEEKLETCIANYVKPASLNSFDIIDTVLVVSIEEEIMTLESLNNDLLKSSTETKKRKDSAIANLEKAETALDEITFEMLIPMAQENIERWNLVIKQENENLITSDSLMSLNNESIEFYTDLIKSPESKIAYFYVSAKVDETDRLLLVSPEFKVIMEE